ncbi:MAG TPA: transcription repressor NadR [Actinomycetota bacterium]|jgi:transcriptional regulator of NAD metabolism
MAAVASERRRDRLGRILRDADDPVTGSDLAKRLGVSRQVIVNDVAILRAAGHPIVGSPKGYVLIDRVGGPTDVIACRHVRDLGREELGILVEHGVTVIDVVVEHAIYGEIRANLLVESRADIERYVGMLERSGQSPLSALTGGVHLHTVRSPNPDALEAAKRELREAGLLIED